MDVWFYWPSRSLRRQVMTGHSTQEFRWSPGVKVSWYLLADRNDGQGQGAFADIANRKLPKFNIEHERVRGRRMWEEMLAVYFYPCTACFNGEVLYIFPTQCICDPYNFHRHFLFPWTTLAGVLWRRGTAVAQLVEALRYKSEGRGFDSRWCHWNFSGRTMALGSTQPLTEMSTGNISWG